MQDPRLRFLSGMILSLAAFLSVYGATAALIWWLVFPSKARLFLRIRIVLPFALAIVLFGILAFITGGVGLDYLFRMGVILLIGIWIFAEQKPGQFLDACISVFGNRLGFDLGLIGEMALLTLFSAESEITQIRRALKIKGNRWGIRSLVPLGTILLKNQIERAEDQAVLLAIRGYRGGGVRCPVFTRGPFDIFACVLTVFVLVTALLGTSEFFILLH